MEERLPIDMILDPECNEPILLYNEKGDQVRFEQIALIPMDGEPYAILKPIGHLEGYEEGTGLVFLIDTEEERLSLVCDMNLIDRIFEVYDQLVAESEE